MNIIEAIKDENLLGSFLGADTESWWNWFAALRVLYGLKLNRNRRGLLASCTGRNPHKLPDDGFNTALFLTGRRSGKSRIAAVIASYEAALAGRESRLSTGERGVVAVCAPTKYQARVVKDYIRGCFTSPMLSGEVTQETQEGFTLANGVRIAVLAGDWRTIRGYTLLAAIVDEAAFFGYDAESKVKSDTELIRAIKPGLATVGGKLIAISSPYARKGWCFKTYQRNFGNNEGKTLVWNCPSKTMNPKLPQSVIDEALAEDLASAKAEYLGEFRDDVSLFLPREVVAKLVVPGRYELLPNQKHRYFGFADLSGGRSDDAALAIAHRESRVVVLDYLRVWKAPFNPQLVVLEMARDLKRFGLPRVTGDNYAAEFVNRAFRMEGINYFKSEKAKSELYGELLPRLCSGEIELLDNEKLISQIAGLERRTRSGGRDIIDHPPNGHDDLANAVAGVAEQAFRKHLVIGSL
ncbi:conserved hypothetical protein [Pirellula staleyi DSM 6068]|uniref:Terminase large subunit gp17-like C-terminal domain-containing protein n=1 Tax=Pirellula staleyi (strain ATCC 27377 / DSM 6068 / ICPB 4128) TaxID=530564 RepID=D2R2S7_PIRSD|nr:conserved hypothetical protein [Pirellula staleyi DSM 6068]